MSKHVNQNGRDLVPTSARLLVASQRSYDVTLSFKLPSDNRALKFLVCYLPCAVAHNVIVRQYS